MGAEEGWKGRLVEWVEKASFEKIRRLLEVSELERHYKVLLTLKNLADVRRNPTCGASISGGAKIKIADWRLVAQSPLGLSASNSGGSRSAKPSLRRNQGGGPPERLPLPSRGGKPAPRVLKVKNKKAVGPISAPDTQVRDFIPWVHHESSQPLDLK